MILNSGFGVALYRLCNSSIAGFMLAATAMFGVCPNELELINMASANNLLIVFIVRQVGYNLHINIFIIAKLQLHLTTLRLIVVSK